MLHRRFPETKISPSLISRIYKKFRIKKKIVQIKKYSNAKNHKKIAEQKAKAFEDLEKCLKKKMTVYYLDEAMFTVRT